MGDFRRQFANEKKPPKTRQIMTAKASVTRPKNRVLEDNLRQITQIVDDQMAKLNSDEDELPSAEAFSRRSDYAPMTVNFYQKPFTSKESDGMHPLGSQSSLPSNPDLAQARQRSVPYDKTERHLSIQDQDEARTASVDGNIGAFLHTKKSIARIYMNVAKESKTLLDYYAKTGKRTRSREAPIRVRTVKTEKPRGKPPRAQKAKLNPVAP